MSTAARLCVVIVNYRTAGLVLACIDSLHAQLDQASDRVVVVDNASGGRDVLILTEGVRTRGLGRLVTVIESPENGGFSAGNNTGVQTVPADFYLLANSDTIFRDGAVAALMAAALRSPRAALVGPRLEQPDGLPLVSCFRFPKPLSEAIRSADTGLVTRLLSRYVVPVPPPSAPWSTPWISFAAVLVRSEALDSIGPMDTGYFMYFEDVDFCRRARAAGYDVLHEPSAHVVHLEGQSSGLGQGERVHRRRPGYYYRSRARYYTTVYGVAGLLRANLCWLAGRVISLSREVLGGRPRAVADREFLDIWKRE